MNFESAVPVSAELVITKGTDKVDGKLTWNEERTVATFESTGNFAYGEYTVTVTNGTSSVTAKTTVEAEKVSEIKILNEVALTRTNSHIATSSAIKDNEACIYYDVYNQYGESIRNSTSINWTVSSCDAKAEDKSAGLIVAQKKNEAFSYGTVIYITGVNVKSGVAVSASVTVGMAQAIDTVEFAGFVSKADKTKKLDTLPNDFSKDTYSLLYRTYDQNHNLIEASADNIAPANDSARLTFISDNVLLIKSEFKDGDIYVIDGIEYSSVKVEPGMYVDKGGEVNITAISNKTGGKSIKNFVVGTNGLLKSMTLGTPSSTIADGDTNVEIPFTAKDADGKDITNYETIARSSNSVNLTATEGTLVLYEKNDGTAGLRWTDADKYVVGYHDGVVNGNWNYGMGGRHITYNPFNGLDKNGNKISINDDVDRNVSLTSVVIGGESDNIILPVSDMRRPSAIKEVRLPDDNNDTIIVGGEATINFYENITYLDQYGKELPLITSKAFWKAAKENGYIGDYKYGIHVETIKDNLLGGAYNGVVYDGTIKYTATTGSDTTGKVIPNTVKYSISALKKGELQANDISKVKSVSYNIVPISEISDFYITDVSKLGVTTSYSLEDNGNGIENITTGAAINDTAGDLSVTTNRNDVNKASVKATYKGLTLTVPNTYLSVTNDVYAEPNPKPGSDFLISNDGCYKFNISAIKANKLLWRELYDINSAKNIRKDAIKKLEIEVTDSKGVKLSTISKSIKVSDAESMPASITFTKNYNVLESDVFNPYLTDITLGFATEEAKEDTVAGCGSHKYAQWNAPDMLFANVKDQYGQNYTGRDILYTVSAVKENTGAFAHKADNFTVKNNGSKDTRITGAELGDTFTITATVENTNITDTLKVTVGADNSANVASGKSTSETADHALREILDYDR